MPKQISKNIKGGIFRLSLINLRASNLKLFGPPVPPPPNLNLGQETNMGNHEKNTNSNLQMIYLHMIWFYKNYGQ